MVYFQPVLPALMVAAAIGLARPKRFHRLAAVAALILFLWSWMPVAWLLSGTLEWHYPVAQFPAGDADAIVVLGGAESPADASQPEALVQQNTYLRCRHAAWLYKHWRAVPVIAAGGPAPVEALADLMRHVLEAEGVPPDAIWTEARSSSTYENAVFTAQLLRGRGIRKVALVTEAYHMRRAEGCFRKQGLAVTAVPCSYRTLGVDFSWAVLVPNAKMMTLNDDVLHEWIGLAVYKVAGRI
ncbi:MAG TPA: YdcF family protein [Bryobacteraceae bacterium]|nr:YdcF family protein [Bryobacteraceae bacterium]